MITLLVNFNNIVIALVSGSNCGIAAARTQYTVCVCELVQGMLIPLLYQGLLQITVFVSDPLGEDIIDFPILEYQLEMAESCLSQLGTRRLYKSRQEQGLSPLPNAHLEHSLGQDKDSGDTLRHSIQDHPLPAR